MIENRNHSFWWVARQVVTLLVILTAATTQAQHSSGYPESQPEFNSQVRRAVNPAFGTPEQTSTPRFAKPSRTPSRTPARLTAANQNDMDNQEMALPSMESFERMPQMDGSASEYSQVFDSYEAPMPSGQYGNQYAESIGGSSFGGSCDGACGSGCGGSCDGYVTIRNPLCTPLQSFASLLNRMQFRVSSATFYTSDTRLPVLATTDSNAAAQAQNAALENGATTQNLFGGNRIFNDSQSGYRGDATLWIDNCQDLGVFGRLYDSGSRTAAFSSNSTDNSILARPFVQVNTDGTQAQATNLLTFPGLRAGNLDIVAQSRVQGGDLMLRKRLAQDELIRTDFIYGYQQTRFSERVSIATNSTIIGTTNRLDLFDNFATASQFNGGELGLLRTAQEGCWYFDGMFKLGLGRMNRSTNISGSQISSVAGSTTNFNEGLLARRTNSGFTEDNTFVVIPEFAFTIGYRLTEKLHFNVGYNFLQLPKVTRVADAIDSQKRVNLNNNLIGGAFPNFTLRERNLTVQTLDLGLQYNY